jgi:transmembrane sensor
MEDSQKHINPDLISDLPNFLGNASIPWHKTKEEVWNELSSELDYHIESKSRQLVPVWMRIAAAAVLVIALTIPAFMRFYYRSVNCPAGRHSTVLLPDGSTIIMNASSTINYHPFWWKFSREVNLKGEAFFKVQKGIKFEVVSNLGKTSVLGTSFNIYARNSEYKVACFTGIVKVVPRNNTETHNQVVVLRPNDKATLTPGGSFTVERSQVDRTSASWIKNEFVFTSAPFAEVVAEIERQYGVTIKLSGKQDFLYTGNFTKRESIENVLTLICKPFDVKYFVNSNGEYQIMQNN